MTARIRQPVAWTRPRLGLLAVGLALLGLAGYGFTLGDFFLCDDFASLEMARDADGLWDAASPSEQFSRRWLRPLPNWLWWLNYKAFGLEPLGYRLCNLSLHVINALLLAWLASVLIGSRLAGSFAGAAFVLLPTHPEAVTWISARYDLLCATGVLAALLAWTRYLCPGGRGRHLVLACAAGAVGLASKEMALCLPLLAAAVALVSFRPLPRRARLGLLAIAGVTGAYLVLRLILLGGMGGIPGTDGSVTSSLRGGRLSFLYESIVFSFAPASRVWFPPSLEPLEFVPLAALALGLAVALVTGARTRILNAVLLGALLFLLTLAPIASWTHITGRLSTRYLYLPSAFACVALATSLAGAPRAPARRWQLPALISAAVLGPWLTGVVIVNQDWHEAARQAESMVESLPVRGLDPSTASIIVTDVPGTHRNAYLFLNGFPLAVQLFTEFTGRVRVVDPAEWEQGRARFAGRPSRAYYRWNKDQERWQPE